MRGGFYDLNILVDRDSFSISEVTSTLKMAYELGYDTVAINTVLEADALLGKKDTSNKIPSPLQMNLDNIVNDKSSRRKFKVLHRLTVVVEDPAQTHKLQTSEEIKQYDIIAACPTDEHSFQICCSTLDIDVISLPFLSRMTFYPKPPQIRLAIERGIFFEICYAPSLNDDFARRYTISNARIFNESCKQKNIFVSSQARKPVDLRGPYDVANLCQLFGLKPAQGIHMVSSYGRQVVMKAECRKSGKGVFKVVSTSELPQEEKWKVAMLNKEENETDEAHSKRPRKRRRNK